MTDLESLSIAADDFTADSRRQANSLIVEFRGNGDMTILPQLRELFIALHEQVMASELDEVVVVTRHMEFMNSSSFNVFINWIRSILGLDEDKRYRVRFVVDPEAHWQTTSLRALATFGGDLVTIDADGGD